MLELSDKARQMLSQFLADKGEHPSVRIFLSEGG